MVSILAQLDPGNSRAAVRASSCHVRLGEFGAAVAVLDAAAETLLSAEIRAQLKEVAALQAAFAQVRNSEGYAWGFAHKDTSVICS